MTTSTIWDPIGRSDQPVPATMVAAVNDILFAADPSPADLAGVEVCIVLGSRNCAYKADRAAELFAADPGVRFVACGANPSATGQPEAELIRDVLLARGVGADRVLIDEHSTNTIENLRHAEALIGELIGPPERQSVAVLSSGFHRRHVVANLPASLAHALYISATGLHSGPDTWHTNAYGRAVILHELHRPGFRDALTNPWPSSPPEDGGSSRSSGTLGPSIASPVS